MVTKIVAQARQEELDHEKTMALMESKDDKKVRAYEFQKRNYLNTIKKLHSLGYKNWTVFDNYGQIVVLTSDLKVIFEKIHFTT